MILKNKKIYKLGIIGQQDGKCCRGWCLDCEVIRRPKKGKAETCSICKGKGTYTVKLYECFCALCNGTGFLK